MILIYLLNISLQHLPEVGTIYGLAKMHNHPLGFGSVANRLFGVLILQYNHLGFLIGEIDPFKYIFCQFC